MSGWDWIHGALELGTLVTALGTQKQLNDTAQIEAARVAIRQYMLDIDGDLRMVSSQRVAYPLQASIVLRTLESRLRNSGFLSGVPILDFTENSQIRDLHQKIMTQIEETSALLSPEQKQIAESAARYVIEIPMLQQAIPVKKLLELKKEKNARFTQLSAEEINLKKNKKFVWIALAVSLFILLIFAYGSEFMTTLGVLGLLGSVIGLVVISRSPVRKEIKELKSYQLYLESKINEYGNWQQLVSYFNGQSSQQMEDMLNEHVRYLQPILGNDFSNYLTSSLPR